MILIHSSLSKVASDILKNGPQKTEDSPRRVRVLLRGIYIFDTTNTKLVWEHPYYPAYYFPTSALQNASYESNSDSNPSGGEGFNVCDIKLSNGDVIESSAVKFSQGPLDGYTRLDSPAMDGWFEEDDPIYGHPNDPYKRIDIRRSSRPIRVEIDGVTLADASWAMHLFETMLPARYYLPRTSVDWELLRPSETTSLCPYKGEAKYYNAVIGDKTYEDIVWWYATTPLDTSLMQNMMCFYNEKVDIFIDGKKQERPKSKFA